MCIGMMSEARTCLLLKQRYTGLWSRNMMAFEEQVPWLLKQSYIGLWKKCTLVFEGYVISLWRRRKCTLVFKGYVHWSLQISANIHWSGRVFVSQCKWRLPLPPWIMGLCSDLCSLCGTKETLPSTLFCQGSTEHGTSFSSHLKADTQ